MKINNILMSQYFYSFKEVEWIELKVMKRKEKRDKMRSDKKGILEVY